MPSQRTSRVAVAVFLKDEVSDVAGWLAWHVTLKFDTILVLDDISTDGTEVVVKAAADMHDIRYHAVEQTKDHFYHRQEEQYRRILQENRDEFAWILFIDSDEYLMLEEVTDVKTFLAGFADADAIGINWRIHGNNNQVLKPLVPAPMAYPQHSSGAEAINRHVKSFVRPDRVGPRWINVHCFDIDPSRYRDTRSMPMKWSSTPGIAAADADYGKACIMHFQNRSMEHFVDRAKRRKDSLIDVDSWVNRHWNGNFDPAVDRFVPDLGSTLARIEQLRSRDIVNLLKSRARQVADLPSPATSKRSRTRKQVVPEVPIAEPEVRAYHLITAHGTMVVVDTETNEVGHGPIGAAALEPLVLFAEAGEMSHGLLARLARSAKPLRLNKDRQASQMVELDVVAGPDGRQMLRTCSRRRYLCAEPPVPERRVYGIVADRHSASDWELFELSPASDAAIEQTQLLTARLYFSFGRGDVRKQDFLDAVYNRNTEILAPVIQALMRRLGATDRYALLSELGGELTAELLGGSPFS